MDVLVIEDEEPAVERLIELIGQYDSKIRILAVLSSISASIKWFSENRQPDLIFLDVHLADGLCFEIFNEVKIQSPIIFCTAYNQYALDAFRFHSIDYLLKPLQYEKLEKSLKKMNTMLGRPAPQLPEIDFNKLVKVIQIQKQPYKTRFMVKIGTKIKPVKIEQIAYFFSSNKLTLLVDKEGRNFPVDYSLDDLMTLLDPELFFHVNRKLIIHIDAVHEIHPYFKGRLKLMLHPALADGSDIVISSQKTPNFKIWLGQ